MTRRIFKDFPNSVPEKVSGKTENFEDFSFAENNVLKVFKTGHFKSAVEKCKPNNLKNSDLARINVLGVFKFNHNRFRV